MSTVQEQARALGDPTRHAIFTHIVNAQDPVGIAELTERLSLNHNAIRQHLTKLVAADLVVEERASAAGRGRPRLVYSVDPAAESRWGAAGPYERLSTLLTEVISTGDSPFEVGQRMGRREALALPADIDPRDALVQTMARNGFEPMIAQHGIDVEVVLHRCPFASTAEDAPDVVCTLHYGMAAGVAETVEGIVIDDLIRTDPRRGQCRLIAHVEADDA